MKIFKYICVISIIFLINGCFYTDYVGFYHLSRESENFAKRPATADELNFIEKSVKNIAADFGFAEVDRWNRKDWEPTNVVDLFKSRDIKTPYDYLKGSNSTINIYMVKDPRSISILIRDWKNTIETDFMKAFKDSLEKELSKEIDMKKVRFRRKALSLT